MSGKRNVFDACNHPRPQRLVLCATFISVTAWAVESGDIRKVKAWRDEDLYPEFQADKIDSGLIIAAWNGNIDMMTLFVERGAHLKMINRNGEQPLQLVA